MSSTCDDRSMSTTPSSSSTRQHLDVRGQRRVQLLLHLGGVGALDERLDQRLHRARRSRAGPTAAGAPTPRGRAGRCARRRWPRRADGCPRPRLPRGPRGCRAARCRSGSSSPLPPPRARRPPAPPAGGGETLDARSSRGRVGRRRGEVDRLACRQLDHEPRPRLAVAAVLDPHPAAVHADVLVDERQPEPGALAAAAPPGAAPRAKRSKISARSSTGTPGPWSSTAILTWVERLVGGVGVGDA